MSRYDIKTRSKLVEINGWYTKFNNYEEADAYYKKIILFLQAAYDFTELVKSETVVEYYIDNSISATWAADHDDNWIRHDAAFIKVANMELKDHTLSYALNSFENTDISRGFVFNRKIAENLIEDLNPNKDTNKMPLGGQVVIASPGLANPINLKLLIKSIMNDYNCNFPLLAYKGLGNHLRPKLIIDKFIYADNQIYIRISCDLKILETIIRDYFEQKLQLVRK